MIGTIGRLGQARRDLGLVCVSLFTLAATASAAAFGGMLGTLGHVLWLGVAAVGGTPHIAIIGGLALFLIVCAVFEVASPRLTIPQRRRQVPRSYWYRYGPRGASFRWGAELGLGFRTFIVYPLYFGVLALATATGSVLYGASIMASYGCGLGLWLLWIMLRLQRGADGIMDSFQGNAPIRRSHLVNGAAAACLSAYLLIQLAVRY